MRLKDFDNIEILSNENIREYDKFIFNNQCSTIYHTSYWKDIITKTFKYKPFYIISRNQKDEICSVLPLFYVNNFFGKRLESISWSAYGGAIGEEKYVKGIYKKALKLMDFLNCKSLIIREFSNKNNSVFMDLNMSKFEKWNKQYIKIVNPLKMWNLIDKSNRTNIRVGIKNNLTVEAVTDLKGLKEFYDLYLRTQMELGLVVCSFNFYKDIWDNSFSKKFVKIFIARHNGKAISSTFNFLFKKTVYSVSIGWDKKYSNLKANNFIDWYVIKWCYYNGYDYFDFGLTDIHNNGLFSYKNSFSTINEYYSIYFYPKRIQYINNVYLLKNGGKFIISKLPKSLVKSFGTFIVRNVS